MKKWCLFHATDFQSLMYPCFFVCRILGIFPHNINALTIKTSKARYFLSTIVTCILCFLPLMIIINKFKFYNDLDDINTVEIFFTNVLCNFTTTFTFVSSSPRIRLLQTIQKISSRLPSEIYRKQCILIHAKDIFGFLFFLVYTLMFYYIITLYFLLQMYYLYITLVVFQIQMLYINCVCVLKSCFERINDELANLLINDESHIVKWINHEQTNLLLLMELKALKKQHLMVSDTVRKLNIIFSPQLLAIMTSNFFHITFEIYFNMVQWEDGSLSIIWTNQIYRLYAIPYFIIAIVQMALIAWACETGKNQAIKIRTIIHDVLNNTDDKKIKRELQLFSLQIMHHNNTFSAKGLILDATLIRAMIATIATYVLILIQFLIASHSCDGKTTNNLTQASY